MMLCNSCEAIYINGVFCHEHGCPDAWKGEERECEWCGTIFKADDKEQRFCDEGCAGAYNS